MPEPKEIANKLVEGVFETLAATADEKVAIGGEIFDALLGTDKHALVDKIPGLTPAISEQVFDFMKAEAVRRLQEKIGPKPDA